MERTYVNGITCLGEFSPYTEGVTVVVNADWGEYDCYIFNDNFAVSWEEMVERILPDIDEEDHENIIEIISDDV